MKINRKSVMTLLFYVVLSCTAFSYFKYCDSSSGEYPAYYACSNPGYTCWYWREKNSWLCKTTLNPFASCTDGTPKFVWADYCHDGTCIHTYTKDYCQGAVCEDEGADPDGNKHLYEYVRCS